MASIASMFPITLAPRQESAALNGGLACGVALSIYASCRAATPGFAALPASRWASCACYQGSTWVPQGFDNEVKSCFEFIEAVDPAESSIFPSGVYSTLCQVAGNVRHVTATLTGTASYPEFSNTVSSCAAWTFSVADCAAQTSSFLQLPWVKQASCACYSNHHYDPGAYDRVRSVCLDYFSTAFPLVYSELVSGTFNVGPTPCKSVGNVIKTPPPVTQTRPTVSQPLVTKKPNHGTRTKNASGLSLLIIFVLILYIY